MTDTATHEATGSTLLPAGWATADLGDLLEIVRGISFPSTAKKFEPEDGYIACLRTTNVQREVQWDNLWFVPKEYLKRDEQLVKPLDILISTANSFELVGKVAQVHQMSAEATLGAFISLIRVPSQLDAKFFYYLLSWGRTQERIRNLASTTTNISNVSTKKLRTLTLQVPPLNEQRRIVEKIEELFTKLDAGVRSLEQARAQLKIYRRSVLKAAIEGELSHEWREAHKEKLEPASELLERILRERREKFAGKKYKEPISPDTSGLAALPHGWAWATVDQLASAKPNSLTDGPFGSNLKTAHYTGSGPRVVRLQNIAPHTFVDVEAHISEEHYEGLKKHAVYAGDLVIRALGEPAPVACAIPTWLGKAIVKADCIRFKPAEGYVSSPYIMYALNSHPVQRRTTAVIHGIGRPRLNLTEIKSIAVPLPPIVEQSRIAEEIERRLSVVDKLEGTVEENLKQAGALRQSILKRAFSGELVPQDSDDEPASALLERIRAERQVTKQKTGKKSVGSKRKDPADDWVPELFPKQGA
ncbi:MAG: hypothetical protein CYG60_20605 [Actinobacteria bacterium]|nr:MAG: hypothetical protein CYG60_20605 [Actinomycetota bacterium]